MAKKKAVKKKSVKKAQPKKKPAAKPVDELAEMRLEMVGKDPKTLAAADAVWDDIQNTRADYVFANVFARCSCPTLRIQWACDKFWYDYVMSYGIQALEAVYGKLKSKKIFSREKAKVINDGDDRMWIIEDPQGKDRRIMVHTGQSHRVLFVYDESCQNGLGTIHVRRFYDRYKLDTDDSYDVEEEKRFVDNVNKHGMAWAVREAHKLTEYADDIFDNPYPERLGLEHYIDNKFEMEYGDARDKGYLFSARGMFPDTGGTLHHHTWLKVIFDCLISNMITELYPCGTVEFLSQRFDSKGKIILTKKTTEDD